MQCAGAQICLHAAVAGGARTRCVRLSRCTRPVRPASAGRLHVSASTSGGGNGGGGGISTRRLLLLGVTGSLAVWSVKNAIQDLGYGIDGNGSEMVWAGTQLQLTASS